MKRLLTAVFFALICALTFSQKAYNLSQQVMVPAGNLVTAGNITYQQTVGETAVEISLPSFYNLSQGFQQPRFIPPSSFPVREGNGVDFFPNPVSKFIPERPDIFSVRMYGVMSRHYRITIINLLGSLMYVKETEFSGEHDVTHDINMGHYGKGTYIATVISADGVINRSFKIEKL